MATRILLALSPWVFKPRYEKLTSLVRTNRPGGSAFKVKCEPKCGMTQGSLLGKNATSVTPGRSCNLRGPSHLDGGLDEEQAGNPTPARLPHTWREDENRCFSPCASGSQSWAFMEREADICPRTHTHMFTAAQTRKGPALHQQVNRQTVVYPHTGCCLAR